MTQRYERPFYPVNSTAPSFLAGATNVFASTANALESTAIGRVWQHPSNRVVRLAEKNGFDAYVSFGTSVAVAASSDSILFLGGTVEDMTVRPSDTYIAIVSASTTDGAEVNITLGYGS